MVLLQLEKERLIWRARQVAGPDHRRQSSFYPNLDAHLQGGPGGGHARNEKQTQLTDIHDLNYKNTRTQANATCAASVLAV